MWIAIPIFAMERDKGGIFSKTPDWKSYLRSKKNNCIDQWMGKHYCIMGRIQTKQGVDEQVRFIPNMVGGSLLLSFKLNIWTFLSLKNWQVNNELGSLLSPTNMLCLKDYLHNFTKYEIKGTLKIPIFLLLSELGKIWKYNIGWYS